MSDSSVNLYISRDGGHTYGSQMQHPLVTSTVARKRLEWRRLGMARDWTFKLETTQAVKLVLIGAYGDFDKANK